MNEMQKIESHEIKIPAVENAVEGFFSEISKLDKDNIIVKSNCKFCNHPLRFEAELKFEQGQSYAQIERFFNKYAQENPGQPQMGFVNVKAHLTNHYQQQIKNIWMKEYSERLHSVMKYKIDIGRKLEIISSQLNLKFHEIASDPTVDPLKVVDALTKLTKGIIEVETLQSNLRGDLKTVNVVIEKFTSVWLNIISSQPDPVIRKQLVNILDVFQEKVQGVEGLDMMIESST